MVSVWKIILIITIVPLLNITITWNFLIFVKKLVLKQITDTFFQIG